MIMVCACAAHIVSHMLEQKKADALCKASALFHLTKHNILHSPHPFAVYELQIWTLSGICAIIVVNYHFEFCNFTIL